MRPVRMDRSDSRVDVSHLRQRALAYRLAGRLASARQALPSSTGSDCRGRRRKAKQGETKKRQFVQIPQRSKNLHITTTFEGHVSTGPRRHSWNRLRDWAEINPVSVCDQKKVGGRDRDRTGDPLLANSPSDGSRSEQE
jgi:hypothetical protein